METYVYDKAKYQMTGDPSTGAPSWEHAFAMPMFFLRWCLDKGFLSEEILDDAESEIAKYKMKRISFYRVWETSADLVFTSDMLIDEANAFAMDYYEYNTGRYVSDIFDALGLEGNQFPLFTEESYPQIKAIIDDRYEKWKAGDKASVLAPKG